MRFHCSQGQVQDELVQGNWRGVSYLYQGTILP